MTERQSLVSERKKAHAKMRDEIRIGVKDAMLKSGITRDEIRTGIKDEIFLEVKKAMIGTNVKRVITEILREEIKRICGDGALVTIMRNAINQEAQQLAAKFVNDTILVKAIEPKETW